MRTPPGGLHAAQHRPVAARRRGSSRRARRRPRGSSARRRCRRGTRPSARSALLQAALEPRDQSPAAISRGSRQNGKIFSVPRASRVDRERHALLEQRGLGERLRARELVGRQLGEQLRDPRERRPRDRRRRTSRRTCPAARGSCRTSRATGPWDWDWCCVMRRAYLIGTRTVLQWCIASAPAMIGACSRRGPWDLRVPMEARSRVWLS